MKTFKKFAIAAVALMLLTTSCLDNTEPAGIAALRGAKSEYIKAQTLVEQANAELIKAEVAIKNAQAKQEEATAAKLQYDADIKKLDLDLQKANNQALIEAIARQKQVLDAQLQKNLEVEKAAMLQAQAATQKAQEAYLQATAQLNILKTIGIPELYKVQYNTVYGKLTTAWSSVNSKQATLLTNQTTIMNFDSYSNANQILVQETTIANKAKEITAKQKELADYKLLNDKSIADQKTLLTGYDQKLTAATTTLATLNNSIGTQANALNDIYTDLNTKNNAYSAATLFSYKLAVPTALQAQYGKVVSFTSGENYFNSTPKTINKYDVTSGAITLVSFNTKVYEYKDQTPTNATLLSNSPEYWKYKIFGVQELADQNANLAALLKTKNDKEDAYKGTTNGNLKAWQDALTAYNANPTLAVNITNLNNTSDAVWGSQARTNPALGRTVAVDAVWNPTTSMFEDKNSLKTFSLNPSSTASYIAYISAKYNYENLQTTIVNQVDIKKMFDAATTALAKIKTDVLAISDPIKTATDNYDAKVIAINSTVVSKNIANDEKTRYQGLISNINSVGVSGVTVTSYDNQIATLTQSITNLEQQKKALEESLAEYKKYPTTGGKYVEVIRKEVVNLQTELTDLGKEIDTYTKQLATLLEYINGTKN